MKLSGKTLLAMAILAGFLCLPAASTRADVTINPAPAKTKSVVIRQGGKTLVIRTDPDTASRLQKMLKRSDRVTIRTRASRRHPYSYYHYPEEYYYKRRDPAYSLGRALGYKLAD